MNLRFLKINQNDLRVFGDCFWSTPSTFDFCFWRFSILTSNMTNFPPVAFSTYKFVWAETLQKVSSYDLVWSKIWTLATIEQIFHNLKFRRPSSPEILFLPAGQLARQSSVIVFQACCWSFTTQLYKLWPTSRQPHFRVTNSFELKLSWNFPQVA